MALPIPIATSPDLNAQDAQLVWELVSDITPKEDVLIRHGMTPADLKAKLNNPMFRSAYVEAKRLWSSDMNAQDRIKVKATMMVEDALIDVYRIIKDDTALSVSKLEAFEKLGKLAQVMGQKPSAVGERHTIIINVGEKPTKIEFEQPAIEGETA